MKASFKHKLKAALKPNQFLNAQRDMKSKEELDVCNNIVAACSIMETKGWKPKAVALEANRAAASITHAAIRDTEAWARYAETQTSYSRDFSALAAEILLEKPSRPNTTRVGTSHLDEDKGLLIHCWNNPTCAMNFVQGWSRLWQALIEFRIFGIAAPASTTFSIQAEYVTVVALPSAYVRDTDPVLLDSTESLARFMLRGLCASLHIPDVVLPLYRARDGKLYVLSLAPILHERLEDSVHVARKELLLRRSLAGKTSKTAATYLRESLIAATISSVLKRLQDIEDRSAAGIVKEGLLRSAMRSHGVNMCFLFEVNRQATARSIAAEGDERTSLVAIAGACLIEILGRTLKHFVRVDIALLKQEGKKNADDRLDVINRIARLTLTKDKDFWAEHINRNIREKFGAPEDFTLAPADVHLPTVLRVMSTKIGCIFGQDEGRFSAFNEISAAWALGCELHPALVEQMNEEASNAFTEQQWSESKAFAVDTDAFVAFTARALATSILLDKEKNKLLQLLEERRTSVKNRFARAWFGLIGVELPFAARKEMLTSYVTEELQTTDGYSPEDWSVSGFAYLQLITGRGSKAAESLYSAACFAATKVDWMDVQLHPCLLSQVSTLGERASVMQPAEVKHFHDALHHVAAKMRQQGAGSSACDYVRPLLQALSVPKPAAGLDQRRDVACFILTIHKETLGQSDHRYFLCVFLLGLLCSYSSDNPKLVQVMENLVSTAAHEPQGPVERMKHRTSLEFTAKKPATTEALRSTSRYGSDESKRLIIDFIGFAESSSGARTLRQAAENQSNDQVAPQNATEETGKEPETSETEVKRTSTEQTTSDSPRPASRRSTPHRDEEKEGDEKSAGQDQHASRAKPSPRRRSPTPEPQVASKPSTPSKDRQPSENDEKAVAPPPDQEQQRKHDKKRTPKATPTPSPRRHQPQEAEPPQRRSPKPTSVTAADSRADQPPKTEPVADEGHTAPSDCDPASPLNTSQNRSASFASTKELKRQLSLKRSVFWSQQEKTAPTEPEPAKQKILKKAPARDDPLRFKGKKKVYVKPNVFPLDDEPDVPPPPETTPCFLIKFSSKIPPHPCEAEMKRRDAQRRALAAMELAKHGVGRHKQLQKLEVPTLTTSFERTRSHSAPHSATMLVGPVRNDEHTHVHLTPERRRPHSTHPFEGVTSVSPKRRNMK